MSSVFDTETEASRRSREAVERAREAREEQEHKEGEPDEELKTAAALERADYLVREVKSSKQQMQNIILHMQQVMAAIKALREQLQLVTKKSAGPSAGSNDEKSNDETNGAAETGGAPTSVGADKRRVAELKQRIAAYKSELMKMKDDLVREQVEVLRAGEGGTMSGEHLQKKAEEMVAELLQEVEN